VHQYKGVTPRNLNFSDNSCDGYHRAFNMQSGEQMQGLSEICRRSKYEGSNTCTHCTEADVGFYQTKEKSP
jgi:hypothetical protein